MIVSKGKEGMSKGNDFDDVGRILWEYIWGYISHKPQGLTNWDPTPLVLKEKGSPQDSLIRWEGEGR